jgi:hypothetical protein
MIDRRRRDKINRGMDWRSRRCSDNLDQGILWTAAARRFVVRWDKTRNRRLNELASRERRP